MVVLLVADVVSVLEVLLEAPGLVAPPDVELGLPLEDDGDAAGLVVALSDEESEGRKKPPLAELLLLSIDVALRVFDELVEELTDGETLSVVDELDVDGVAPSVVLVSLDTVPREIVPVVVAVELVAGGTTIVVSLVAAPGTTVVVEKLGGRLVQSGMQTSGFVLWIDAQWGALAVWAEAAPKVPARAAARRLRVTMFLFMRRAPFFEVSGCGKPRARRFPPWSVRTVL